MVQLTLKKRLLKHIEPSKSIRFSNNCILLINFLLSSLLFTLLHTLSPTGLAPCLHSHSCISLCHMVHVLPFLNRM